MLRTVQVNGFFALTLPIEELDMFFMGNDDILFLEPVIVKKWTGK